MLLATDDAGVEECSAQSFLRTSFFSTKKSLDTSDWDTLARPHLRSMLVT